MRPKARPILRPNTVPVHRRADASVCPPVFALLRNLAFLECEKSALTVAARNQASH